VDRRLSGSWKSDPAIRGRGRGWRNSRKPIKFYLWHGNAFRALNKLQSLEIDWETAAYESKDDNSRKLLKGVEELRIYVEPSGIHPELGRALSQWRADRLRLRRVRRESSGEQTSGEATADRVNTTRRAPAFADLYSCVQ